MEVHLAIGQREEGREGEERSTLSFASQRDADTFERVPPGKMPMDEVSCCEVPERLAHVADVRVKPGDSRMKPQPGTKRFRRQSAVETEHTGRDDAGDIRKKGHHDGETDQG